MAFRGTVFNDPEVMKLLAERFVCVGIAHNGAGRRKDAEGDWARKVVGYGGTLQGFRVINTAGDFLGYSYDFRPQSVLRMLRDSLGKFQPVDAPAVDASRKEDPRFAMPEGARVVRATTKILGGYGRLEKEDGTPLNDLQKAWKTSLGRENLWIRKDELEALARGELMESLKRRIVRYHLVDNTRGTPTAWKEEEIRKAEIKLTQGRLEGSVHLETPAGDRGFQADLLGFLEATGGQVTRFDVVVRGQFWGEGRYTPGAPKGKFPLATAFTLLDPKDDFYKLMPDAVRSYSDYLR